MCARFSLTASASEIARLLDVDPGEVESRLNIAPTDMVIGAVERDGERQIREFKWGLIPSWAKDTKIGQKMINARSETLAEKSAFKNAFERRRCIIPASSFYEWKHIELEEEAVAARSGAPSLFEEFEVSKPKGRKKIVKQPYAISLKSGEPFGLAGLWEMWSNDKGEKIRSCTVVTTSPNEAVAELHNRMPVMLKPEQFNLWLDLENRDVHDLFAPIPSDQITIARTTLC